jgi:hypothetical protein
MWVEIPSPLRGEGWERVTDTGNKWGQVLGYKFLFSNALTVLMTVV